jgi:hypothetical protein
MEMLAKAAPLIRIFIYAGILEVRAWGVRQPSKATSLVSRETSDRVQALLDGKGTRTP